eukprot:CAMPEP_0201689156 /NCGR_PEP_ID=MMETSP0578-20130828/2782_1 /ASSEMBLY_ACC=CAM_ASM_000663 /TAXON_ID=267565 /ORGANISM="Skeletonema grethea, Strain CCMP 1804" /LENGTH=257 /DNA_ID=CAMNT_0048173697 /DNA_START=171 /DNA_END=940 /DNA_ORIENTATION=-
MPPRSKKPRLIDASSPPPPRSWRMAGRLNATFDDLGVDELAIIFGFFPHHDIMRVRLNKKMRDAATQAIVPMTEFAVKSVRYYNLMAAMTTALPNLQRLSLRPLPLGDVYSDGADPDEGIGEGTDTTNDINIISSFRKLRILYITGAPLNGRYPVLFDFPLLQNLTIHNQPHLKFDLGMLEGLPMLEELDCFRIPHMSGNLRSLRVLKDTLEVVTIHDCENVRGNFADLADFPNLMELDLYSIGRTNNVSGDIRDIG